ncbi:MAG: hypothetical protein WC341_16850 [Bacteroidales bacterium]|jgi:hypothetical protein
MQTKAVKALIDKLEEIIDCPCYIDEATIPAASKISGDYSDPQIVATYSIAYHKIIEAKKLIAEIKANDI